MEDEKDIEESMNEIDLKLKEIDELNNRDYHILDEVLDMYEEDFEKVDMDIVSAPFVEYSQDNIPDYYPENGIWFNSEDVNLQKNYTPTEEESEELKKLEEENKIDKNKNNDGSMKK